ncbi:MAG: YraN family protein [Cyclobacteriaceae bacterium]|nr:YraN family protein [Cyclobacteriaceae bacterium]
MSDKIQKGKAGEELAANFLVGEGYEIVQRNYRYKRLEIDLIVRKDNWLVFVEVKMRSSDAFGFPEEFVDQRKAKKVVACAVQYAYQNNYHGNVRYDVIAISMKDGEPQIRHFEDAFY